MIETEFVQLGCSKGGHLVLVSWLKVAVIRASANLHNPAKEMMTTKIICTAVIARFAGL
jgi:hypothetical protein